MLDEAQGALFDRERRHRQRDHYPEAEALHCMEGLRALAPLITDLLQVAVVIRDPNDDMVIATAPRAQAAYIVTRDKALLSLHDYEGITMMTPEACIAIVRERGRLSPGADMGGADKGYRATFPHLPVRTRLLPP
jgi:PIN domain